VVHSEVGEVALQGEALPYFTFSYVVHMQVRASGDHGMLTRSPEGGE
jgi:hypothetical protein